MAAYYNENDPYCAQWLRNLIAGGHIAQGDVDERSIADVQPNDVAGYDQCHFFAGIGGWSYALRLAEWPDDRPIWTGSCPCQPFSAAGKGKAADDERHLWPHWFGLIRACRPPAIFGEQVEAAIGWGWLDTVFSDLGAEGYAVGAAVLPACSIGAPHIRQRLWFVADSINARLEGSFGPSVPRIRNAIERCADDVGKLADTLSGPGRGGAQRPRRRNESSYGCDSGELGDAGHGNGTAWLSRGEHEGRPVSEGFASASPWRDLHWLPCTDGKARPTQPGLFPLATRIPGRVGRLRAYGNAIVPQLAAEFIKAAMDLER